MQNLYPPSHRWINRALHQLDYHFQHTTHFTYLGPINKVAMSTFPVRCLHLIASGGMAVRMLEMPATRHLDQSSREINGILGCLHTHTHFANFLTPPKSVMDVAKNSLTNTEWHLTTVLLGTLTGEFKGVMNTQGLFFTAPTLPTRIIIRYAATWWGKIPRFPGSCKLSWRSTTHSH